MFQADGFVRGLTLRSNTVVENLCMRPNIGPAAAGPAGPVATALPYHNPLWRDRTRVKRYGAQRRGGSLKTLMWMASPGNGVCGGAKIFGSALLQPARSVCVSLSAFSLFKAKKYEHI